MQWSVPAVMKGIQVTEYGGLDVLRMENQLPVPNPSPTQVIIDLLILASCFLLLYSREYILVTLIFIFLKEEYIFHDFGNGQNVQTNIYAYLLPETYFLVAL